MIPVTILCLSLARFPAGNASRHGRFTKRVLCRIAFRREEADNHGGPFLDKSNFPNLIQKINPFENLQLSRSFILYDGVINIERITKIMYASKEQYRVCFLTRNKYKIKEAQEILSSASMEVIPITHTIYELQTDDTNRLVNEKVLEAFRVVGRPLFVEHTGLYLKHLNDLPGGLTQVFWDRLRADRFAELFGRTNDPTAIARTVVGYTDGKSIKTFQGEIAGRIVEVPRGSRDFQWDCVFQPDDQDITFAEMGNKKNTLSMRRKALDLLAKHLKTEFLI